MANEPMWKTFGHNERCSIRDCGLKPTKRVDLAVVGIRRYEAFGNPGEWKARVGSVEIAVCDRCATLLDGEMLPRENWNVPLLKKPPKLVKAKNLWDFIGRFVLKAVEGMKEAMVQDGSKGYGVLEDVAGRECEQPGECGKTKPYCLPCRARNTIDKGLSHEQG